MVHFTGKKVWKRKTIQATVICGQLVLFFIAYCRNHPTLFSYHGYAGNEEFTVETCPEDWKLFLSFFKISTEILEHLDLN